jgi:hypothetical protein
MRGHQALIALRMAKKRPSGVWVNLGKSIDCLTWDKHADTLPYPEIEILPTENADALDLRFVVGLTVHISGCNNYKIAKKFHEAFLRAAAHRVITVVGDLIIDSEHGESDSYVPE